MRKNHQLGRNRRQRLGIEPLENRWLMAGDVTATFDGFNLEVTGDEAGNNVAVYADTNGGVRVEGVDDTGPGNSGKGDVTTVNGGTSAVVFQPGAVLRLEINTGNGDDVVAVNLADFSGAQLGHGVNTGKGDDVVDLNHTTNGGATVQTGDGRDSVVIRNGSGQFLIHTGGSDLGNDQDQVLIESVVGIVNLNTGIGKDHVTLRNVNTNFVGSVLRIDTGPGHDHIVFDGIMSYDVSVFSGDGNDTLELLGSNEIHGDFVLDLGDGNDLIDATNGSLLGASGVNDIIFGGEGHDTLLNPGNLLGLSLEHLISFEKIK